MPRGHLAHIGRQIPRAAQLKVHATLSLTETNVRHLLMNVVMVLQFAQSIDMKCSVSWCMPSHDQLQVMLDNCTYKGKQLKIRISALSDEYSVNLCVLSALNLTLNC